MNKMLDQANFKRMQAYEDELKSNKSAKPPVLYKTFACEIKSLNPDTRSFTAVASEESTDRMGDIIRVAGWQIQNYLKNPVVLWSHDYDIPSLGHALSVSITPTQLLFEPSFATKEINPLADQIYNAYVAGHQRAFSVGFIPLKYVRMTDQDGYTIGYDITQAELLEISCVNVPAHQNALTNGMQDTMSTSFMDELVESLRAEVAELKGQVAEMSAIKTEKTFTDEQIATFKTMWEAQYTASQAPESSSDQPIVKTGEAAFLNRGRNLCGPSNVKEEPAAQSSVEDAGCIEIIENDNLIEVDEKLISEEVGKAIAKSLNKAMGIID